MIHSTVHRRQVWLKDIQDGQRRALSSPGVAPSLPAAQVLRIPPRTTAWASTHMAAGQQAPMNRGFSEEVAQCAHDKLLPLSVRASGRSSQTTCKKDTCDTVVHGSPLISVFLTYLFDHKQRTPATIERYRIAIAGALKHWAGVNFV